MNRYCHLCKKNRHTFPIVDKHLFVVEVTARGERLQHHSRCLRYAPASVPAEMHLDMPEMACSLGLGKETAVEAVASHEQESSGPA